VIWLSLGSFAPEKANASDRWQKTGLYRENLPKPVIVKMWRIMI
jgi:hypothetical protein